MNLRASEIMNEMMIKICWFRVVERSAASPFVSRGGAIPVSLVMGSHGVSFLVGFDVPSDHRHTYVAKNTAHRIAIHPSLEIVRPPRRPGGLTLQARGSECKGKKVRQHQTSNSQV